MTAIRTAVLVDETDKRLGACQVPETTFVIKHDGRIFVRGSVAIRLTGGGVGIMFIEHEPLLRPNLIQV